MKDGAVRRFVFRTFRVKWNVKAMWWATHRLVCVACGGNSKAYWSFQL